MLVDGILSAYDIKRDYLFKGCLEGFDLHYTVNNWVFQFGKFPSLSGYFRLGVNMGEMGTGLVG